VLAGCGIVYGLAALVARGRWGGRLPPLAVLAAVLWFWGYVQLVDRVGHRGAVTTHLVLFPLGTVVTLGLGWWLLHRPAQLDRLATFLTLVGGLLVGWSALSIGRTELRSARAIRQSAVAQRLAQPIGVRPGTAAGPKRDIYLIILDEYANAEVTRARYGFDNHVFLDSLRRLGFVVPVVTATTCTPCCRFPRSSTPASSPTCLATFPAGAAIRGLPTISSSTTAPSVSSNHRATPSRSFRRCGGPPPGTIEARIWSSMGATGSIQRGR
jgi:hypothetical protein